MSLGPLASNEIPFENTHTFFFIIFPFGLKRDRSRPSTTISLSQWIISPSVLTMEKCVWLKTFSSLCILELLTLSAATVTQPPQLSGNLGASFAFGGYSIMIPRT